MKQTKLCRHKRLLLALASAALLTPFGHALAQTLTPQLGDLILGFRGTDSPGQTLNLEVDLGNMSNFYGATPGSAIPLPALAIQDLVDTYGSSWYTRTDMVWGAVSSTGRISGMSDGHAPVDTLWATDPDGQPAWNRGSRFAQADASAIIEGLYSTGGGGLSGASSTANSSQAAVVDATSPGSWSYQDLKTAGESFGYFNPSVDNVVSNIAVSGQSVLELYELQPGSGAGADLGELILTQDGLSFQAIPEPSAGALVALGIGSALLLRRRKAVQA